MGTIEMLSNHHSKKIFSLRTQFIVFAENGSCVPSPSSPLGFWIQCWVRELNAVTEKDSTLIVLIMISGIVLGAC